MIPLPNLLKNSSKVLQDHAPHILTALGAVGVVSTAVLAVAATPKAVRIIDTERELSPEKPRPIDVVRLTWKGYIPALSVGAVSIGCIIASHSISSRRQVAMIGAYSLTEKAFSEYKEKVKTVMGENKTQKFEDDLAQEKYDIRKDENREVIITGNGDVLCHDTLSGRTFRSNVETIRKAVNDINAQVINDMYASLNDFYRKLGLKPTSMGDELGWNNDNMLEIHYTTVLSEDNQPCISMDYRTQPTRNYHKIW